MKKWICLLLAVVLCLGLAACGDGENGTENKKPPEDKQEPVVEPTPEPEPEPEPESTPTEMELCAAHAVEKLKSVLKSPSSLEINGFMGVEAEGSYIFAIDYSAKNSLGGVNREAFYLEVSKIKDGFAVKTYGTGTFASDDNQKYTAQILGKYKQLGYYVLDPLTYEITGMVEGTYNENTIELTGKLKGQNNSYEGAWNFQVGDNSYLKLVYFVEGTDLSWYERFQSAPYEITISAVQDLDGHYTDAVIVNDPVLNRTMEERFQTFDYYDREIIKDHVLAMEPMAEDAVSSLLTDATFSMRNNYGGDVDGTHTVTFHAGGVLDAKYTYDGKEYSMYESWTIDNNTVICAHTFVNTSGKEVTKEYTFTLYQYDDTRFLMINADGDFSMVLTKSA